MFFGNAQEIFAPSFGGYGGYQPVDMSTVQALIMAQTHAMESEQPLFEIGMYEIGEGGDYYEIGGPTPEELALAQAILSGAPDPTQYMLGQMPSGFARGGFPFIPRPFGHPSHPQAFHQPTPQRAYQLHQMQRPMGSLPYPPALGQPPMRVEQKSPSKGRLLPIGFDSGADIAAGGTLNVSTTVSDVFSPKRLIIGPTVAPNFTVNDVRVGQQSQLSSVTSLPAEMFLPDAVAVELKGDTAQISQLITINVTNISLAPVRFRAGMLGFVARL